ncbi:MAG TPA: hypothetical protein VFV75_05275 [Candidatus Polarisedimenticolaceae bacterium]|nr:hypothetical protein [Candidatus Polarisedimenticolaceae bacterium]
MRSAMVAVLLALSLGFCLPAPAADKAFTIDQFGGVRLDVPEGWTAEVQGEDAPGGRAIRLKAPASMPIGILLTPTAVPHQMAGLPRKGMDSVLQGLRKIAVESEVTAREMSCRGGRLLVASATDRTVEKPSLEDFKYVDQGWAAVGPMWVFFTVLSNYPEGPERTKALETVRSLAFVPPGAPWRREGGTVAFQMPGKRWRLALDLPGWEIGATTPLRQPGVRLEARIPSGWLLTAFLEKTEPGMTAVQLPEEAWKTMQATAPAQRVDVRRSERGPMAVLRHRVPTGEGKHIDMENVNAYLVRDDVWVDVHLSKSRYTAADEPVIDAILRSIRFEDGP